MSWACSGSSIRGRWARGFAKSGHTCQKCKRYHLVLVPYIPRRWHAPLKSGRHFSQVILCVGSHDRGFLHGKVLGYLSSITRLFDERPQKTDRFHPCSLVDCTDFGHTIRDLYQGQFRRISARLSQHVNLFVITVYKYPIINSFKSSNLLITRYFVIS